MKFILLTTALLFMQNLLAQTKLVKDLDGDGQMDTVTLDRKASKLFCRLSTASFTKTSSQTIEDLNTESGIITTKSGFKFSNNWMRAGYSCQFRYDAKTKRIQLIGMDRYEFGNAANDGSGESSVNLLTNDYIGNWNHYDDIKEKLIKLPTIKTKMPLPKTYLDTFSDNMYFRYAEKCSDLYTKEVAASSKR